MSNPLKAPLRWARWLYDRVVELAAKPAAAAALAVVSFFESIIFPIPPDVMLIPMGVARPNRALFYAAVCTLASVAGAAVGYWLGATAMDTVGRYVIALYQLELTLEKLLVWYNEYDAWIVAIAGFSPIPYKLITLSSGAAGVNFPVFILVSLLSRGARFFLVSGLLMAFGDRAAIWIDKHFDKLTLTFVLLLVGFALLATL